MDNVSRTLHRSNIGRTRHDAIDLAGQEGRVRTGVPPGGEQGQSLQHGTFGPVWIDDVTNVKVAGVKGDGTTNDTAALQELIDTASAAGGGVLFFPRGTYCANLVLKSGVTLTSLAGTLGHIYDNVGVATIRGVTTSWVIDTPDRELVSAAVVGFNIRGVNEKSATGGIRIRDGVDCAFRRLHIHGFQNQGILTVDGNPNVYEDLLITACLLNRTREEAAGAFELHGSDHYVSRIEAGISGLLEGTVTANQNCHAIMIAATACYLSGLVGEFSDRGFLVIGGKNRFVGCRGDHNYGHDWEVKGDGNKFSSCEALRGGLAAANTYSGFRTTGNGNVFAACTASTTPELPSYKYCFEDTVNTANITHRNAYVGCSGANFGTAMFKSAGFLGSTMSIPNNAIRPLDAATSIDVTNAGIVYFSKRDYPTTTVVAEFIGGIEGQEITLISENTNIVISNGPSLKTSNGTNVALAADRGYKFINYNAIWYQI